MGFVPPDIPRLMAGSGRGLSHLKSIRGLKFSYAHNGGKDLILLALSHGTKKSDLADHRSQHQSTINSLATKIAPKIASLFRAPVWKINVEVVRSLAGEAGGHVCQRTPTAIQASTPHSTRIITVRITAQLKRCIRAVTGNARMHPANKAQTAVCKSLTATRGFICREICVKKESAIPSQPETHD